MFSVVCTADVISKWKGPSTTLRGIRTSTYQSCSIEEKQFEQPSTIFCNLILDFCVKTRTRFSLRNKRLFGIIEVEITRDDCICYILLGDLFRCPMTIKSSLAFNEFTS